MKLSNTLFTVALAQYDYEGFDYFTTSTVDVQTTPISIDPNVSQIRKKKVRVATQWIQTLLFLVLERA